MDQERPPVVAAIQHASSHQQHQDESAEQEEEHVDAFGLSREARAASYNPKMKKSDFLALNLWRPMFLK